MPRKSVVAALLLVALGGHIKAEDTFPPPGTPKEFTGRVGLKHLLGGRPEVIVDGKSLGYVVTDELRGRPHLDWVTKQRFAFWRCGGPYADPRHCIWSVVDVKTGGVAEITLPSFDSANAAIGFRDSLMAYLGKLPNGNIGCFLYDWNNEKFLGDPDTKRQYKSTGAYYSDRAEFSADGTEVNCGQVEDWDRSQGQGDAPPIPKYRVVFKRKVQQ